MRKNNSAESWERVYEVYQQVNFSAFDFESIKQSILDYMKVYYPEDFNDYIESSEFIAIVEAFAYVGEILAYRVDMNAHENFIQTAERKESVLRLAKMLSYNARRNVPARGLVKITAISTTETVFDDNGNNLANKTIRWNDFHNENWKLQFLTVIERILDQRFGSVSASDRVQVNDLLFELYGLKNIPTDNGVLQFNVSVDDETLPMEIVPISLNQFGPLEARHFNNQTLDVVFVNDGLGDSSNNGGFFFYVKQGELFKKRVKFDGVTPNQFTDMLYENSNETDLWVNNVDPDTGEIVTQRDEFNKIERIGEWERVDSTLVDNVLYTSLETKNRYEVETLDKDMFRIVFGDGRFSNIPSGDFDIWYRVSANRDLVIPTTTIQNKQVTLNYYDKNGKEQRVVFTISLERPITNAVASEDIEHIKRAARGVYYTQDRMVNSKDYNEYFYRDSSILKLKAINRTFAGDSKYISWHDPREYYENVTLFATDGVVYYENVQKDVKIPKADLPAKDGRNNTALAETLVKNYLDKLLNTNEVRVSLVLNEGLQLNYLETEFRDYVMPDILTAISDAAKSPPNTFYIDYAGSGWYVSTTEPPSWYFRVTSETDDSWTITYNGTNIVFHSDTLKFWNSNKHKVLSYDTLKTNLDRITVLKSNISPDGTSILANDYVFDVLEQKTISVGPQAGETSIHDLVVAPELKLTSTYVEDIHLPGLVESGNYVYFRREKFQDGSFGEWEHVPFDDAVLAEYNADTEGLWKRESGRELLNFVWTHVTPRYHIIDPSPSNIIDVFVITRQYYIDMVLWLSGIIENKPTEPSTFELSNTLSRLSANKMVSDDIVFHAGKIVPIFGDKAIDEFKATFKVIRNKATSLSDNQIKSRIVDYIKEFFHVDNWDFGQTFYFTELAAYIHAKMPNDIESITIVPRKNSLVYGDLFQLGCAEDEILQPSINVDDIVMTDSIDPRTIRTDTSLLN